MTTIRLCGEALCCLDSASTYLKDVSLKVMDELGQEGQCAFGKHLLCDARVKSATVAVILDLQYFVWLSGDGSVNVYIHRQTSCGDRGASPH